MIEQIATDEAEASAADDARETIPPAAAMAIAKVLVGAEVEARVVAELTKPRSTKSRNVGGGKTRLATYKPETVRKVAAAIFAVLRGGA